MVLGLDHGEALISLVHHLAIRSLQLNAFFSTNRIFGTFLWFSIFYG